MDIDQGIMMQVVTQSFVSKQLTEKISRHQSELTINLSVVLLDHMLKTYELSSHIFMLSKKYWKKFILLEVRNFEFLGKYLEIFSVWI